MPTLLDQLEAQGRLNNPWKLPTASAEFGFGADNIVVFTAWAAELGSDEDRAVIKARLVPFLEASRTSEPGVFHKNPENKIGQQSVDNVIAICYLAWKLGLPYATEIYRHGYDFNWTFDNKDPSRGLTEELLTARASPWFGRFLGFAPFVKAAAGFALTIREQWAFGTAIEANFGRKNTALEHRDLTDVGNFALQLFENRVLAGRHYLTSVWIAWWAKNMGKRYGDLAGMLAQYDKPADRSPLVAAAKGRSF
jgi:hypothetical protein